jgi:predicted membrane channel-forming protein YqfA (hemolysin III family)
MLRKSRGRSPQRAKRKVADDVDAAKESNIISNLNSDSKSSSNGRDENRDSVSEPAGDSNFKSEASNISSLLADVNVRLQILPETTDNPISSPISPKYLARMDEVDPCFHFRYITEGYRTNYEFWDTFLSVFEMHNETMNIWSHLIGFFSIVYIGLNCYSSDVVAKMTDDDYFYYQLYLVAASICMLFSAVFHWFCCLSPVVYDKLLVLDLSGVALLVAGSYFPAVYYGFVCDSAARTIHIRLAYFVLALGLAAPHITYEIKGQKIRPFILASLAVLGLCPFIHWFITTPAHPRDELAMGYYLVFILYGLGFWFWYSGWPEKLNPKSYFFVYMLPSHTLWHLCVVAAVFWWFRHINKSFKYFQDYKCSHYEGEIDSIWNNYKV